jgi:hypothetical protein
LHLEFSDWNAISTLGYVSELGDAADAIVVVVVVADAVTRVAADATR